MSNTSQSLQFNNQVSLVQHSSVAEYYTHAECNQSNKINQITILRCCNIILLKDGGHNLEDAGCILAAFWRMQFLSRECSFFLENAVSFWRMQFLSGGCSFFLEDAVSFGRMQFLSGECSFFLEDAVSFWRMQFLSG